MKVSIVTGLTALLLISVAPTCGTYPTGPVPQGQWGGEHIGLAVRENGAVVEYDCASGTIDQSLVASRGAFVALGTHTRAHGGPVRVGEAADRHPARYDGRIDGQTMTLVVTLTDSGENLGIFTLLQGQSARVVRCY